MKFLNLSDSLSRTVFIGALLINCLNVIAVAAFFNLLPAQVPLFYSRPWGEPQLASTPFLFAVGGLAFLFLAVNFLLTRFSSEARSPVIVRILAVSTLLATLIAGITVTRIIFVVL